MDDPSHSTSHLRYAARRPAGTEHPVTLSKNGVRQLQRFPDGTEKEVICVGLACSECFSGPRLHKILKKGFEMEQQVMEDLLNGRSAKPLSIHTSSGVSEAMAGFLEALEPHVPWKNRDEIDWCVSMQIEGASAVWAAVDLVIQTSILSGGDKNRVKVAVAETSYHGPPSTSFGAKCPLWTKHHQVKYPVPKPGKEYDEEELVSRYEAVLDENKDIGVLLIEPQWGSSTAALPWPKKLLQGYVKAAQSRGIKVVSDEVMCGLGRHGHGTLFISEAWDLNPDAVTFGKAIGGGVFPISGAILKQGRELLYSNKSSVMQSHTYAGSSARALMTATEVLRELPNWFEHIAKLGDEMDHIFRYLTKISEGMMFGHGQGLMWGAMVSHEGKNSDPSYRKKVIDVFKRHCLDVGVLPYHVPVGGIMVTPVIDIDVGTVYEIGELLEEAIKRTMKEVNWHRDEKVIEGLKPFDREVMFAASITTTDKCHPVLHAARSCTSCSSFVCSNVRSRFTNCHV